MAVGTNMRTVRTHLRNKQVQSNVIICILLLLLLVNYMQGPQTKTMYLTEEPGSIHTTALKPHIDEAPSDTEGRGHTKAVGKTVYLTDEMRGILTTALKPHIDKAPSDAEGRGHAKAVSTLMDEVRSAWTLSNDHERIQALYKMVQILNEKTVEPKKRKPSMTLNELNYHLKVLSTRPYSKTPRPDTCKGCMEYNFTNIINPTHVCRGHEDIVLFIIITTIPKEVKEREAVRRTWGSLTAKNTAKVRHLFLFGGGISEAAQAIIDKESREHGDILQEDFIDNYYNLAYKAIMGYRWVVNNCPGAKYIMRTASDNFIDIPRVLQLLQKKDQTIRGHRMDYAQIGSRVGGLDILRYPNKKWYITSNELNMKYKFFPEYCLGTAFVFHRNATIKFLKASVDVPFFVIEDAYFGMVMKKIAMPTTYVPGFTIEANQVGLPRNKGCPGKGKWYSVHLATPGIIDQLWTSCEKRWTLP